MERAFKANNGKTSAKIDLRKRGDYFESKKWHFFKKVKRVSCVHKSCWLVIVERGQPPFKLKSSINLSN